MRILSWVWLHIKYGLFARRLIRLYEAIEHDYSGSRRDRKYNQALKRAVWRRRFNRMNDLYCLGEMLELTWRAKNWKKPCYIPGKVGAEEDVL